MSSLLIKNIGLLATPIGNAVKRGTSQKEISFFEDVCIYVEDGIILDVAKNIDRDADEVVDAKGRLVTPGLVDAHTHLVFGGFRQNEMKMKLDGVPYLDILKAGGGILCRKRRCKYSC